MRKLLLGYQLCCGQFTPAECGQFNRRMHLKPVRLIGEYCARLRDIEGFMGHKDRLSFV